MNEVFKGGVGSYAVYLMVEALLKVNTPEDAGNAVVFCPQPRVS